MKLEKAKIEELKALNPEGIFEGEFSFNDEDSKLHTVEFVYRKPTTADIESHAKAGQKNPLVANLNLIQSLIVHPEPAPIIDAIREYPAAYGRFCDEAVLPFFGANVTVKSKRL